MTSTEIRDVLAEISDAVSVPPVDQVAFAGRVRAERRRRTTGRALVAGAAAAAVVAAGAVAGVPDLGGGGRSDGTTAASAPGAVDGTVFLSVDWKLTAVDPGGRVHDLGLGVEEVVGWTGDRVYVVDRQSRLVVKRYTATTDGLRLRDEPSPVEGPAQRVELSTDGRYLAWQALDETVHRKDLQGGADLVVTPRPGELLADVAEEGVLLARTGSLVIADGSSRTVIPTEAGNHPIHSDLAGGHVLVVGPFERATLYDVSGAKPELVDEIDGRARLGPYAERVATVITSARDVGRLRVWDGGTLLEPTGLDGSVSSVAWLDETTLLVDAYHGQEGEVYTCDIDLRCGRLPIDGGVGFEP